MRCGSKDLSLQNNLYKIIKWRYANMKKKLFIEGMSCMHCVKHVHDGLMEVNGVSNVNVDLQGKNAVVEFKNEANITDEQLKAAVEDAGYDIVSIENL
jgi:copper ion binding protein